MSFGEYITNYDKMLEKLRHERDRQNLKDIPMEELNKFYAENQVRLFKFHDPTVLVNRDFYGLAYKNLIIIKDPKTLKYKIRSNKNTIIITDRPSLDAYFYFFNYKLKSVDKSIELFGHKKAKLQILEKNELVCIDKFIKGYKTVKTENPVDIVGINYDNKIYKVLVDDLQPVLPDIKNLEKGYNPPLDRKIRTGAIVKVVKKTNTDLKFGDRVKIKERISAGYNRYCVVESLNNKLYRVKENQLKVVKC
jgi:hypothetical protein